MTRVRRVPDLLLVLAGFLCAAGVSRYLSNPDRVSRVAEPREVLQVGDAIPEFWHDAGFREAPAGPTLVLFLTAECPWCRSSVPRWNRLQEEVAAVPGARMVAVSLSDSAASLAYPSQTGFRVDLRVANDRAKILSRWKVAAVPYSVLVEPGGTVRGAWVGVVDSLRYDSIVAAFAHAAVHSGRRLP